MNSVVIKAYRHVTADVCIVVSDLISLMTNQADEIQNKMIRHLEFSRIFTPLLPGVRTSVRLPSTHDLPFPNSAA